MSATPDLFIRITFQSEDPISQSVHDVVQRSFVRHVEKILLVRIAGDILDLVDESLRVLLFPDVISQNLKPGKGKAKKKT